MSDQRPVTGPAHLGIVWDLDPLVEAIGTGRAQGSAQRCAQESAQLGGSRRHRIAGHRCKNHESCQFALGEVGVYGWEPAERSAVLYLPSCDCAGVSGK